MMLGYTCSEKIRKLLDFDGKGGYGRVVYSSDKIRNESASTGLTVDDPLGTDWNLLLEGERQAYEVRETGGIHENRDASPGARASGMHNTSDLSLVDSENVENISGSNHETCKASPEQKLSECTRSIHQSDKVSPSLQTFKEVDGMHLHDEVSLESFGNTGGNRESGRMHHQDDLSPRSQETLLETPVTDY
ncbi:hypothetical protein HOY82DRAFT_544359 [Tuber indicum]|nr:hypothetical protein HOY82DRAFT_544359 [Tuber indicum]